MTLTAPTPIVLPQNSLSRGRTGGVVLMLVSSAAFSLSGSFAKPLYESGWSPAATIAVRTAGAALVLLIPALLAMRGRWRIVPRYGTTILVYGLVAVGGAQLFSFSAVQSMQVGTALLIEYTAPVAIVLTLWAVTRKVPSPLVLAGTALAIAGLPLVLNITDLGAMNASGIVFAFLSMLCLTAYFFLSERPNPGLPPVALVFGALVVASVAVTIVGATGLLPFTMTTDPVTLMGIDGIPWFVPLGVIVVIATAFAYITGLLGVIRTGARAAAFLALFEVLFAMVVAWLILGEIPSGIQSIGCLLIVAGIVLVQLRKRETLPRIAG